MSKWVSNVLIGLVLVSLASAWAVRYGPEWGLLGFGLYLAVLLVINCLAKRLW